MAKKSLATIHNLFKKKNKVYKIKLPKVKKVTIPKFKLVKFK